MNYIDNYIVTYFDVQIKDRTIKARLISPKKGKIAISPYLLVTVRDEEVFDNPHGQAPRLLIENGHRIVSLYMPNHLSRIDEYGEGITGMRNAFVAGRNPFEAFVEDGMAVIDKCIEMGMARPGRILLESSSRGGYMMLRLMAADKRVAAAAAFATVTDWVYLKEFEADKDNEALKAAAISNYIVSLTGRPLYIEIGYDDNRVNTANCCRFAAALRDANIDSGYMERLVTFFCTPDEGHSCSEEWYGRGAKFLLAQCK